MTSEQRDPNTDTAEPAAAEPAAPSQPTFEQRMERFGQEAGAAGERFGRQAEAAADRWSRDPAVSGAFSAAGVAFGLILLALGLWFLADITLGMNLPRVPWGDLWPLALILIGLVVAARGMTRRA